MKRLLKIVELWSCTIRAPLFVMLVCALPLIVLVYVPDVSALDVTVLESSAVKPYEDAIKGFEAACNCNIRQVIPVDHNGISVQDEIRKSRPGLIVAVGEEALRKSLAFKDIPTIYMMVLNPSKVIKNHENVTGVSMEIPAHKQVASFVDVFPWIKRLGVIYNPQNTDSFMKVAVTSAMRQGIVLAEGMVHSPKDVPSVLSSMRGKIDALWVVPDVTVVTPENMEFIMLHSIEFNLPVLTFTDKHVALGAVMSLDIDPYEIGRQAGGIVKSGSAIAKDDKVYEASVAKVSINHITALKMAIAIKDNFKNKDVVKINLDRYGKNAEQLP
ncbi:MAG: ABC transporter substrate-binding protein [Nitrospirota bacterium]